MSSESVPTIELLVRLKMPRPQRSANVKTYTRRSNDQITKVRRNGSAFVDSCRAKVERILASLSLPIEIQARPFAGALAFSCPVHRVDEVKRQILNSCEAVVSVSEDSPVALIQPAEHSSAEDSTDDGVEFGGARTDGPASS